MQYNYNTPKLVTLYGENPEKLSEILDREDFQKLLSGDINQHNIDYYQNKYPELMGFWVKLAKGLAKVGGAAFRGIGKAVRRKRRKREREKTKRKIIEQQKQAKEQAIINYYRSQKIKKDQLKKLIMYSGIALGLLYLL